MQEKLSVIHVHACILHYGDAGNVYARTQNFVATFSGLVIHVSKTCKQLGETASNSERQQAAWRDSKQLRETASNSERQQAAQDCWNSTWQVKSELTWR